MQKLNKLAIYGCICASTIFAVCILSNNVKQDKIKHQNIVIDSMVKQLDTMAARIEQLQLTSADMQVTISDLPK